MSAKISILDELSNILTQKEKIDEGVLVFSKQFKIGQLLSFLYTYCLYLLCTKISKKEYLLLLLP